MHSLLVGFHWVLLPCLPVVRPHDHDLPLAPAHRSEVGHLQQHGAVEAAVSGAHLEHAASQALSIVEGRRVHHLFRAQHPARDPGGHGGSGWRYDDAEPGVTAAPHRTAPSIHEEGNEEAAERSEVLDPRSLQVVSQFAQNSTERWYKAVITLARALPLRPSIPNLSAGRGGSGTEWRITADAYYRLVLCLSQKSFFHTLQFSSERVRQL